MKYFVGTVTKQVIERHLVRNLAKVVSPMLLAQYSEEETKYIGGEAEEITQMRTHLEDRLNILVEGQKAFNLALGRIR
jgi:hypothetical protein